MRSEDERINARKDERHFVADVILQQSRNPVLQLARARGRAEGDRQPRPGVQSDV